MKNNIKTLIVIGLLAVGISSHSQETESTPTAVMTTNSTEVITNLPQTNLVRRIYSVKFLTLTNEVYLFLDSKAVILNVSDEEWRILTNYHSDNLVTNTFNFSKEVTEEVEEEN